MRLLIGFMLYSTLFSPLPHPHKQKMFFWEEGGVRY